MYDARQIANWFIQRAAQDGRFLSIMQLLKLVYIAHGWFMEMRNAPLINNKIEAWPKGPVMPDVYNAFRPQGVYVRETRDDYGSADAIPEYDAAILKEILRIYGGESAFVLSDRTHEPNSPWDITRRTKGLYGAIENDLIAAHYHEKRAAARAAATAAAAN